MKRILIAFFLLASTVSSIAQNNLSGTWKGSLSYMNSPVLDIYYTISVNDGVFTAFLTVPTQGLKNFPLDTVSFDGLKVHLSETKMGSSFKGLFTPTGILGDFTQNGIKIPVILTRGEIPLLKRYQEPKKPYPYREEEVVFHNDREDFDLSGTLTIPEGNGPFTAVILVSGSGFQDRNEEVMGHKPFLVIADYLTRNGIAVLRYDDRGVGKSAGLQAGATTEALSYDAQAAFNYLKSRNDIGKIGVAGHSEGGSIAFLLAAREPSLDFVISLAGPGADGTEVLLSQGEAIAKASDIPQETIEQMLSINKKIYETVNSSPSNDSTLFKSICNICGSDVLAKQVTDPWFYYFIRFSPESALSSITVPLLALNGTKDVQVVADVNLPKILQYTKEGGNSEVTVHYLEGLNHLFQHCKSGAPSEYAQIEETFSEEALSIIKDWIINLK